MKTQRFTRAGLLFLSFLLSLALTGGRPMLLAPAAGPERVVSLPPGSQGPISSLIGADQSIYHARLDGTHFRMNNPEHGLSAEFSADGMQVSAGEHSWGLTLDGYGYGESLQPLPAVDPAAHDNRIEYARGPLSEWYLNGPFGLEQGFTLASPPIRKTGGPLTLALSQNGDLQAKVDEGGKELVLTAASDEAVLRYSGLAAYDAEGRELRTWLEIRPGVNGRSPVLLLHLDDHAARYPLMIDSFVQKAKLTASDKAEHDYFGISVAVSGDVVVVGAYSADTGEKEDSGAAYVFVKPDGGWGDMTQTARLTASDKANYDCFGNSVAISGNVIVVGAESADPGGIIDAGAAYIFVKPGAGWKNMTQTAKLTISNKAESDHFGGSVAISGNVIVVGVLFADSGGIRDAGAAYIFVKPGGGWSDMIQTAELTASNKQAEDWFGYRVSISGDEVVVGATRVDPGGKTDAGAAYVFVKPGSGWVNMTQTAILTASDKRANDWLGFSVSFSGDVVVVGARYADPGGTTDAGAAYVFVKPDGGWINMTQTARLTASDKLKNDQFGFSVAISGEVVVVGAFFADPGGTIDAGAAYVFVKPGGGWENKTQTAKLIASDKRATDGFGYSTAVSTDVIMVGAMNADQGNLIHAGAAYVFENLIIKNFHSQGVNDGDILESGEYTNQGGSVNTSAVTFRLGDNGLDRQYRSLLSFDTSILPDNAVITSVVLKIKKQGLIGTNPFATHQGLKVDIRKPFFGATLALVAGDFQALADEPVVGTFGSSPVLGRYSVNLNSSAYAHINKTGTTQFRLRFQKDDNDDLGDDYVMFYSGDWSTVADQPLLMVQYYIP